MSLRIKELLMIVCLAAFIIFVNRRESYIDINASAILDRIVEVVDISNMEKFDNSDIKKNFGVNANDYGSVVYYGHESVMDCETLLIIELDDESQGQDIMDVIAKNRDADRELFKSYAPDQYKLLSDSILEQKGNYVLYVVSGNAKDIEKAFVDSITG